ncbi:putative Mis12-Mtw1 protein family protein [Elsinoe australis]|uniref:Putative Mis12-Mtw1 protein family protein n=1 Tax=Elsinoe australis TaxID=40998 RepID=A0A4V6DUR7_9PEZI|nr:putative Mis12-Mtw1 protein family protein [Elsinoe australis]
MPMNRAAHNPTSTSRRRTARHLDDIEDDAPPTKKVKADAGERPADGKSRANGAATKKAKTYEESDGAFAFSRGSRSKRGKSRSEDVPEPSKPAKETKPASPPPPAPAPATTKKRPRKTLPVTPEKDDAPKVRRSKRLSGENETRTAGLDDPFVDAITRTGKKGAMAKTPARAAEAQPSQPEPQREESPALQNGGPSALHVAKKRTPKRIDLAKSETPVIRRNKAMRQTSGENGGRRSSAGLRGKRASSLIDSGTSNAVPHTEVETGEFYKHISQDLVEPRRMKQLLVWCGTRALGEKRVEGESAEEGQARHAARTIQDELLSAFASRNDLSNWFDRPDEATESVSLIKKPNPRNVQNVAKLAELEAELARLQAEKASWDSLLTSIPSPSQQPTQAATPEVLDPTSIDPALLSPSQAQILQSLLQPLSAPSDPTPAAGPSQQRHALAVEEELQFRLSASAKDLHFKLDMYHDSLHRLEQFVETAGRVADRVLEKTAGRLEEREQERKERGERENGGVRVGERDTLRALGRSLGKKEGRE